MKLWLSGLALLAATSTAQAENFRIVQSPAQKLDIWIDNIKDNTPQSWCKPEVALRIVANGKKDVSVLENFVPRLGSLLEHQCSKVNKLSWTLNDPEGTTLAQGTAAKAQDWALVVKQQQAAPAETVTATPASGALLPPDQNVASRTVAADRTPWQEFTLQDGCHLRTFWEGGASAPALFIPDSDTTRCGNGSWLSGHTVISQSRNGGQKEMAVTYIHGFPVNGAESERRSGKRTDHLRQQRAHGIQHARQRSELDDPALRQHPEQLEEQRHGSGRNFPRDRQRRCKTAGAYCSGEENLERLGCPRHSAEYRSD